MLAPSFGVMTLGVLVLGNVLVCAALLLPFRRLCRKAGLSLGWAWFAAILLTVTEILPLLVGAWAGFDIDRKAVAASLQPWTNGALTVSFFVLLWLFAWVRWPAQKSAGRP